MLTLLTLLTLLTSLFPPDCIHMVTQEGLYELRSHGSATCALYIALGSQQSAVIHLEHIHAPCHQGNLVNVRLSLRRSRSVQIKANSVNVLTNLSDGMPVCS